MFGLSQVLSNIQAAIQRQQPSPLHREHRVVTDSYESKGETWITGYLFTDPRTETSRHVNEGACCTNNHLDLRNFAKSRTLILFFSF